MINYSSALCSNKIMKQNIEYIKPFNFISLLPVHANSRNSTENMLIWVAS